MPWSMNGPPLGFQGGQRGDEDVTGLRGIDHRVYLSRLQSQVRVDHTVLVVVHQRPAKSLDVPPRLRAP